MQQFLKNFIASIERLNQPNYIYRVSEETSLPRIASFGTDRGGFPSKPSSFNEKEDHNRYIIGSTLEDLILDTSQPGGTFEDKLRIIPDPIILIYNNDLWEEVGHEPLFGNFKHNGRHYRLKDGQTWTDALLHTIFLNRAKCKRYYFALTNLCNRSCEFCSCSSDPERSGHIPFDTFTQILPSDFPFEAQLEGGEPLVHPEFWNFVTYLQNHPFCKRIMLCTNGF